MKRVFADTYYFVALLNERDAAHKRAVAFSMATPTAILVTTRWTLAEVANSLSNATWKARLVRFIEWVSKNKRIEVCQHSDELFDRGVALFMTRSDKDWSLTDCISFALMKETGITEALTEDHHFVQAGFTALLR